MLISFRTDASHQIGTGHVMRCLTLAEELRKRGAMCQFICCDHPGHLMELIRSHDFEVIALPIPTDLKRQCAEYHAPSADHSTWLSGDWRTDSNATQAALGNSVPDWLIVDHYAIDARWESSLRPHCRKILVIDDLADRFHDCDLLLDQNLVANMRHRYDGIVPEHCGLMLGPEYALLQPQYGDLHFRARPREGAVYRVLIYFGGADTDNFTGMAIAAFISLKRDNVTLDVVINPGSPHNELIRKQVNGQEQIVLHSRLPTLAPLMIKADLAIGGGGATSWERCCLGLPTIVITLADNQKPIARELDRRGVIRLLGHKDEVSEAMLSDAMRDVIEKGLVAAWSKSCQCLVDGLGTVRVSSILMLNSQVILHARPAQLEDEDLILQWANDPLVRKNAFVPGLIDPGTHRVWFRKRLQDPKRYRLFVVETGDGLPIGQVRFEWDGGAGAWEIHYALDARARGRNLGQLLLKTAISSLQSNVSSIPLFGRVMNTNVASRRVFESLGFESECRGTEVIYRRVL